MKSVGTPDWIASERRKRLGALESVVGTNATERARIERGYDAMWAKYGVLLRAHLDGNRSTTQR